MILSNTRSVVVYHICAGISLWEYKTSGNFTCDITPPSCVFEASVRITNYFENFGHEMRASLAMIHLIYPKEFCLTSVHLNLVFATVIFVSGVRICARHGHIPWYELTSPNNICTCRTVFGGRRLEISFNFFVSGWIPSRVTQNLRYSHSQQPNNEF